MKNEVKVNVLNQPYGGFPWIDIPMAANENWYNAHNFYGDLAHLDAATLDDVRALLQDLLRAEQRRARRHRRLRRRPGEGVDREILRRHPVGEAAAAARSDASRGRRRRNAPSAPTRLPTGLRSASAITCRIGYTPEWYAFGLIDQALAQGSDSLLYDELVRKQGLTGGVNAGINWGLGNMFDYSGPMLWMAQFFHDSTTPSDKLLAAIDARRREGAEARARSGRRSTARA